MQALSPRPTGREGNALISELNFVKLIPTKTSVFNETIRKSEFKLNYNISVQLIFIFIRRVPESITRYIFLAWLLVRKENQKQAKYSDGKFMRENLPKKPSEKRDIE